jgi:hypothetical protein
LVENTIMEMIEFEEIGGRMDRRMRLRESMIPAITARHLPDFVRELAESAATTTDVLGYDLQAIKDRSTMAGAGTLKTIFQSMAQAGIIPNVAATPENLEYDQETRRSWDKGRKKMTPNA